MIENVSKLEGILNTAYSNEAEFLECPLQNQENLYRFCTK